ncbi:MAG: twin-arginine translocase subunit TatC [Bryobacteraceae bacterium]
MEDEPKEPQALENESAPTPPTSSTENGSVPPEPPNEVPPDPNTFQEDPYHSEPYQSPAPENYGSGQPGQPVTSFEPRETAVATVTPTVVSRPSTPPPPPPPKPPVSGDEQDDEEEGMLRMSFMEHLEELRSRILRALVGVGVAFLVSLTFSNELWRIIQAPATQALKHLGYAPKLVQITPMEVFTIVWFKMPMLVSLFLGSPWVLYQAWAFISPGLYKRERRYAVPFILCTAGLFVGGGLFAYFVAFRYGIEFLLGIGRSIDVAPMVSIETYFDLFVNVILGVALVFEMPVLIFFLTLLHIASPRFLLKHSRYAILAIVIIAAIVTPTPDVFNLMLFAVPMCMLFFVGVFASYLLVLKREGKKFPWRTIWLVLLGLVVAGGVTIAILIVRYHLHLIHTWPFLAR